MTSYKQTTRPMIRLSYNLSLSRLLPNHDWPDGLRAFARRWTHQATRRGNSRRTDRHGRPDHPAAMAQERQRQYATGCGYRDLDGNAARCAAALGSPAGREAREFGARPQFNESCIQGFAKFSGILPANGESGPGRDNTRVRV